MTIFDDIAQAIVAALDALDRFASGAPGDDQKQATEESMSIVAEEILQGSRAGLAIGKFQSAAVTITAAAVAVPFQTLRRNDAPTIYSELSSTSIQLLLGGVYSVEYSVGFTGGTGSPNTRSELQVNNNFVPGTAAFDEWEIGDSSSSSGRAILDLNQGDIISVSARRIGAGAGTVVTIPDACSISIRRERP